MRKKALVIFNDNCHEDNAKWWQQFNVVFAHERYRPTAEKYGLEFENIEELLLEGSIYEASALAEELSRLKLKDGSRLTKLLVYKGYELWWINYNRLYLFYCLPFTQYKKLFERINNFNSVHLFDPPFRGLFHLYLEAYNCEVDVIRGHGFKSPFFLPWGILVQIFLTIIFIPFLIIKKHSLMVFIGDKFEKNHDYDFRMKFIYEELRERQIPFVEFVRSLEPWKNILEHALIRKRPVVYSEAVVYLGKFLSLITGGRQISKAKYGTTNFSHVVDKEMRFKFMLATQYISCAHNDIWAIRIMKLILKIIGVKACFVTAALERNFHAVMGCKLNDIPTVGIMHGLSSKYYTVFDLFPSFEGGKPMAVDKYGVWSEWWKEYYIKNGTTYLPNQLHVSGLMRPLENEDLKIVDEVESVRTSSLIKVLFVPGQISEPKEVAPYLLALLKDPAMSVYLTFRPYRDGFERKLMKYDSRIVSLVGEDRIFRGNIKDAIAECDIVVGSNSTAVLEALLQLKPLTLFKTTKWGDYFYAKSFSSEGKFYAETPEDLIQCIKTNVETPKILLNKLQERFFGNPYSNGSKWVVNQLEEAITLKKN
ncbi:MAG: hypothetical protein HZA95_02670 [Candidatus Vogelbacteria bacterium]|nr:hypothetical protein [Candidatus Vogelbacteria bacterium]